MEVGFSYPVILKPAGDEGGFVVRVPDFPEVVTQGETVEDSLAQAMDAIDEAVYVRMRLGKAIPLPSRARKGHHMASLPALTAAKAALYMAMREKGLNKVTLASRLGCDEKEVRRLLDPHHVSKLPRLAQALEALGKRITVRVADAN